MAAPPGYTVPVPQGYSPPADPYGGWSGGAAPWQGYQAPLDPRQQQLQSFWDLMQQSNAPQNAAIDSRIGGLTQQLGLLGPQYALQQTNLNQDLAAQLARLGFSGQELGLEQGALGRQEALSPQLYGLQQQGFGLSEADIQRSMDQAKYQYGRQVTQTEGSAAARGASNTAGLQGRLGDLSQNLQYTLAGLGSQKSRLGLEEQRAALGYKEQQAGFGDTQKHLDIMSQRLGLDRQQVQQKASTALQQLGLDQVLSTDQLFQAIMDAQAQKYNPLQSMLGAIFQVAPELFGHPGS